MKYIIGYTSIEYDVCGILIPKKHYNDFEQQHGKKSYTEINEEQEKILNDSKVFKSLLATKSIRVLDHLPAFAMSGEDRANQKLKTANDEIALLKAKLAVLEAKSKVTTKESK